MDTTKHIMRYPNSLWVRPLSWVFKKYFRIIQKYQPEAMTIPLITDLICFNGGNNGR